ncbi:GNAT family N-acetyltransferase [Streptococcus cameli]
MEIVEYESKFEKSWVYTKALSYLFSPFFDDRSQEKDCFSPDIYQDTVELIAVEGDQVVGLLDIAIYTREMSQAYRYVSGEKIAYFANLAVHPDYQGQGIASDLFKEAEQLLIEKEVDALAIFTRNGDSANHLYKKWGGKLVAKDFLVVGCLKSEPSFQFEVLLDEKRLKFSRDEKEIPFYLREGTYIVSKEEDLELFDIDELYPEFTYVKRYKKKA